MATSASLLTTEPRNVTKQQPRRRLCYTFGVLTLAICHKAYIQTQYLSNPFVKTAKRMSTVLFLASHILVNRWLAILSFIDDHIVAVEGLIKTIFPPSAYIFDKFDKILRVSESLPLKLEDFVEKAPIIIHRLPFFGWAMAILVSWLTFFVQTLTSNGPKEEEIVIDFNCNDLINESSSEENDENDRFSVGSPSDSQSYNRRNLVPESLNNKNKNIHNEHKSPNVGKSIVVSDSNMKDQKKQDFTKRLNVDKNGEKRDGEEFMSLSDILKVEKKRREKENRPTKFIFSAPKSWFTEENKKGTKRKSKKTVEIKEEKKSKKRKLIAAWKKLIK